MEYGEATYVPRKKRRSTRPRFVDISEKRVLEEQKYKPHSTLNQEDDIPLNGYPPSAIKKSGDNVIIEERNLYDISPPNVEYPVYANGNEYLKKFLSFNIRKNKSLSLSNHIKNIINNVDDYIIGNQKELFDTFGKNFDMPRGRKTTNPSFLNSENYRFDLNCLSALLLGSEDYSDLQNSDRKMKTYGDIASYKIYRRQMNDFINSANQKSELIEGCLVLPPRMTNQFLTNILLTIFTV